MNLEPTVCSSEPAAAYRVGHRNFFKTIWKPMAIEGGGIH